MRFPFPQSPKQTHGKWWSTDLSSLPHPRQPVTRRMPQDVSTSVMKELVKRVRGKVPLPRSHTSEPWIHAQDPIPSDPHHVGKWLIFASPRAINSFWVCVDLATSKGDLGIDAKVSTAFEVIDEKHVICVYTKDWRDKGDVLRVRGALRRLGFTETLYYKTDDDTRDGRHHHTYKV